MPETCAYDDCQYEGTDFEREHYGHHGPSTVCPSCQRAF